MNCVKKNYNLEMEKTLESFGGRKHSLFLHACCAPCSSACLERLVPFFDIMVYFYNPNIHPQSEYFRRRDEILMFVKEFNLRNAEKIEIMEDSYSPEEFDEAVRIDLEPELAFAKEKGERCRRCYEFRMKRAFEQACRLEFDFFATTLTLSPLKDAEKVNEIGRSLQSLVDSAGKKIPKYLFTDFKKKNGFLRSLQLSDEYGLYRQSYCGCKYSLANSLREKAEKNNVQAEDSGS